MPAAADFPNRDSLCERCGYPLVGLGVDGDCPECGQPIDESSPTRRTGPPWQKRMTPGNWVKTLYALVRHPKRTFRTMSFDESNLRPRMFLLSVTLFIGAYTLLLEWLRIHQMRVSFRGFSGKPDCEICVASRYAAIAVAVVLVLTYIEIFGVMIFSRQRGWRVGFQNAERIACYASPGWIVAALVILKLVTLWQGRVIERLWNDWIGPWSSVYALALGALIFSLAILGFETLVWLGVRQAKYANRLRPLAASRSLDDPSSPSRPGRSRGTDPPS